MFWELTTAGVYVNQTLVGSGNYGTAIIDTGTSLALFPSSYFTSIISSINKGCNMDNSVGLY